MPDKTEHTPEKLTYQEAIRRITVHDELVAALERLSREISAIRHNIGPDYPAIAEAWTLARTVLANAQPADNPPAVPKRPGVRFIKEITCPSCGDGLVAVRMKPEVRPRCWCSECDHIWTLEIANAQPAKEGE